MTLMPCRMFSLASFLQMQRCCMRGSVVNSESV